MASMHSPPAKLSIVAESDEALAHKLEELNRHLSSDSKAVNFAKAPVTLSRKPSNSSLVSSASDENASNPNGSTLSAGSDKKHTRWPSFTNAFPSFLNAGANSAPLSTMSLWQQWDSVINNWDQSSKKKSQVADLIKRGIPDEFRPVVWQLYTGAHDSPLKSAYHKYLKETSPFERAIRRDVSRTYPKHDFFKDKGAGGQTSLYNVMKAYSLHDREVGYCQGSGFIVGLLLMQMNEVDAFAVLVQLMNEYHLRELYKPCMSELGVRMHQLDGLLAEHLPDLHTHFVAQAFAPSLYASAWFLTLFATAFPLPMATRVMDLFIAEGMDFILRLSLAILTQFAPRLLPMDMESMIFFLQQTESTEWEDRGRILFETATALKLNQRKLKKLRNEYLTMRSQERGEQIELRRLRTENGLLLQRLARMEEDNNYLASQLVDCNVQRAQLAEEVIRLRGDVASLYARESTATLTSAGAAETPSTVSAPTVNGDSATPVSSSSSALLQKQSSVTVVNGASATASPETDLLRERDSSTSGAASWTSLSPCSGRVNSDRLMIETINQLETDLVHVRVREAETSASLRDAKAKIRLLEEKLENVLRKPMEQVEVLQDELMRVKLREAEGLLQMKELRQRLNEIQSLWEDHCGRRKASKPPDVQGFLRTSTGLLQSKILGKSSNSELDVQHLSDRILEAKYLTQIADLQQKVKELTAHEELASRQASRHDDMLASLQDKLDSSLLREASLIAELKQAECSIVDVEAKRKSDGILWRIREIELNSQLAEIKQRYGELECLHDAEYTSNALRDLGRNPMVPAGAGAHLSAPCDSACSSAAPTPEVRRASEPQPAKSDPDTPRAVRRTSEARTNPSFSGRLSSTWKNLPPAIMTDSIGPLEDICLLPDDPMITSIYLKGSNVAEMP